MHKYLKYLLAAALLAGPPSLWWSCSFEETIDHSALSDPLQMPLADILDELANSSNQQAVETAITHLLEKTGIGLPVKGSKYTEYVLPEEFVSELAQDHLAYLRGELSQHWGRAFDLEKAVSDDEWTTAVEFEEAVASLQEQATAALATPEVPNSALLLAAVTNGTQVPATIPVFERADVISPIQEFMFEVWTSYQSDGEGQALQKSFGAIKLKIIVVDDCIDDQIQMRRKTIKELWSGKKQKRCLRKAKTRYEKRVKKCFDNFVEDIVDIRYHDWDDNDDNGDFGEDDDQAICEDLQKCLKKYALGRLERDVEKCRKYHDQGGDDGDD